MPRPSAFRDGLGTRLVQVWDTRHVHFSDGGSKVTYAATARVATTSPEYLLYLSPFPCT